MNKIDPPILVSTDFPDGSREKNNFFSWQPFRSLLVAIRLHQCHVDIGADAKVHGPVNIGDYVRLGANAVISKDMPHRKITRIIHTAVNS